MPWDACPELLGLDSCAAGCVGSLKSALERCGRGPDLWTGSLGGARKPRASEKCRAAAPVQPGKELRIMLLVLRGTAACGAGWTAGPLLC